MQQIDKLVEEKQKGKQPTTAADMMKDLASPGASFAIASMLTCNAGDATAAPALIQADNLQRPRSPTKTMISSMTV